MVSIVLNFVNIYGVHYITFVIKNKSTEPFIIYFDSIEVIVNEIYEIYINTGYMYHTSNHIEPIPDMKLLGKVFEHIKPELFDVLQQQLIQQYKDDKEINLIINRYDKLTDK